MSSKTSSAGSSASNVMSSDSDLQAQLAAAKAELSELDQIFEEAPDQFDDELQALQVEARTKVDQLQALLKSVRAPPTLNIVTPEPPSSAPASTSLPEPTHTYRINDDVTARYSKDKNFYPATVLGLMGSASDPIYTVKFKGYPGLEKVRAHDIRAIATPSSALPQKRKADDLSTVPSLITTMTPSYHSSVISAAPTVNKALINDARSPTTTNTDPSVAPPEKRIRKNAKKLEQGKQAWQNFQQKSSKGKAAKVVNKQSMFRTGESATARVGFTGSGQAMTGDAARSRHEFGNGSSNRDDD